MVKQGENVDIGTNKTPPTYQVKLRLWPRQINRQIKVCMDYITTCDKRNKIVVDILISSRSNNNFLVLSGMWAGFRWVAFRDCSGRAVSDNTLWVRQVESFFWVTHPEIFQKVFLQSSSKIIRFIMIRKKITLKPKSLTQIQFYLKPSDMSCKRYKISLCCPVSRLITRNAISYFPTILSN